MRKIFIIMPDGELLDTSDDPALVEQLTQRIGWRMDLCTGNVILTPVWEESDDGQWRASI